MIPKHVAEAVLKAALSSGGDFAEIYAEDQHSSTATLQSGKIEQVVSGREHGAGIRVFLGTRTVYAYTNDTSLKGLTDTALKAAAAIGAIKEGREVTLAPSKVSQISPILLPPSNIEVVRKTDMLKEACFAAKEYDPLIAQVTGTLLEKEKNVLICNSEGLYAEDSRTHVRILSLQSQAWAEKTRWVQQIPALRRAMSSLKAWTLRLLVSRAPSRRSPCSRLPLALQALCP